MVNKVEKNALVRYRNFFRRIIFILTLIKSNSIVLKKYHKHFLISNKIAIRTKEIKIRLILVFNDKSIKKQTIY